MRNPFCFFKDCFEVAQPKTLALMGREVTASSGSKVVRCHLLLGLWGWNSKTLSDLRKETPGTSARQTAQAHPVCRVSCREAEPPLGCVARIKISPALNRCIRHTARRNVSVCQEGFELQFVFFRAVSFNHRHRVRVCSPSQLGGEELHHWSLKQI